MLKLGQTLDGPGPKDAAHIAVVPVLLGEDMKAGDHARVVCGKAYRADHLAIGIIDPYLEQYHLWEGTWVYMFLYPNSITGVLHNWLLPEFDDNSEIKEIPRLNAMSVEWLENFAHRYNTSYDAVVVKCQEALSFGTTYKGHDDKQYSWVTFYGTDIHEVPKGFWTHFRKATGWKVLKKDTDRVTFTCSC